MCPVDASVAVWLCAVRTLKRWKFFSRLSRVELRDQGQDFLEHLFYSQVTRRRTAGAGSAAHRGTDRRCSPSGASSRRSCAADGGTDGGRPPFLRYAVFPSRLSKCRRSCLRMRRFCRDTQLVEQLVEVPTPVSFSSLFQRTVEQHVDIPVPVGGGRNAGLQGFLPEQSSTFTFSSSRHG